MKNTDTDKIFFFAGSITTILGVFAKLFNVPNAVYLFAVGVAMLIYVQLKSMYDNRNADLRQKRLARNGLFSALLLALAVYFMYNGSNSWVVAVLIYALSSLFLSFRGNQK